MNREILFRGKRTDNGEWIDGALFPSSDGMPLICNSIAAGTPIDETAMCIACNVDPDTVGEFTGLTDKNGKRIWEGDVVEFDAYGLHYKGVVSFIDGNFCVMCNRPAASPFLDSAIKQHDAVCIGNIHDNPELMEGE